MKEIPAQHLEVMAESFRRDGLDGHHAVIRATLDGIADLRAVLRDAEKARKEAERERDAYRHEWNVSSRQQGAETRARYAAESRAARLLTAMREIEGKTGHFGEAPPLPEWMPMLSLIAWVGKTARAALAEVGE